MGFFDLFKKKPVLDTSRLVINLTENGLNLNGVNVAIPTDIKTLEKLLGTPRKTVYRQSGNINYTWDELGIYCYTYGGNSVNGIGVKTSTGMNQPHTPAADFSGIFNINGQYWFDVMKNGETALLDDEIPVFKRVALGKYSAVSEFTQFGNASVEKTSDFMNIEVQLK